MTYTFKFQTFDDVQSKTSTSRSLDPGNLCTVHQTKDPISQSPFSVKCGEIVPYL